MGSAGIAFSGLASGLPVDDIVNRLISVERRPIDIMKQRRQSEITQQSQFTAVSSRVRDFKSSITKLTDARLGDSLDLFETKKATSSDSDKVSATVTNSATQGSFTVNVTNLATATKANSTSAVGALTTAASSVGDLALGQVETGNFTVFVNGEARQVTVSDGDTVGDVINNIATEIAAVSGAAASASVDGSGKIVLNYQAGTTVSFGANGDTSNFATLTHLSTGSANGGLDTFTAKFGTSTIKLSETLVGNNAQLASNTITAGSFTIGQATFSITASSTLSQVMADINGSDAAGVRMSYNSTTNKIEVVSKSTGKEAITFDDGGTGFLASLGLVSGSDTLTSQTLGSNAKFKINGGVELESKTNTADSSITSLTGVTLNLAAATGGSDVTVDISQDTSALTTALNDFVTKLNTSISFIDEQTKKGAALNGENVLVRFRNQLRSQASDSISGLTDYDSLSAIGITTGAVNSSPSSGAPSQAFSFSQSKFLEALGDKPEEVKKLLIGEGTTDGILNKLNDIVEGSLDPEFGMFSARDEAANTQIKNINDAITKAESRLTVREKQLRANFASMERLISQFQEQGKSISGLGK